MLGQAPQGVDGGLAFPRQRIKVPQVVGHGQTLMGGARIVRIQLVGHTPHQLGHERVAALGHSAGSVACIAQRFENKNGGGRCIQPHAVGQTRIIVGIVRQNQGDTFFAIIFSAQHAPPAGEFSHKSDALWLGLVAHHIGLGALAAPGQALETDGPGEDAAIHFGQHYLHGQVARRQTVRIGLPLLLRATRRDELQHRGIARHLFDQLRSRLRCPVLHFIAAIDGGHCKAGCIQHHDYAVFRCHRLQQREAGGVLERIDRHRYPIDPHLMQCSQHGIKQRGVSRFVVCTVKHQHGYRRTLCPRCGVVLRLVHQCRRQHRSRCRALAQAKGGVPQKLKEVLRIAAPAFAQATPQVATVVVWCGAAQEQLQVFKVVARKNEQLLVSRCCLFHGLLHHIGPIAKAAQMVNDHNTGVA